MTTCWTPWACRWRGTGHSTLNLRRRGEIDRRHQHELSEIIDGFHCGHRARTLGVLVGLFTFVLGIGPRTILDLSLNVILLLTLIAGLALTKRGAGHEQPAWMAALAKQTQPPGPRMSDSGGRADRDCGSRRGDPGVVHAGPSAGMNVYRFKK